MGPKIQGPKNREIRYTCSPGHVRKYLKNLSPQQKDYVRKIGFGSFLSMADFELDKDLTLWLFQRFNCRTESLEFEGGISIRVRPLVKSVLGIPSGPLQVIECSRSYFDPAVYHRYYIGNIDLRGKGRHGVIEKGSKFMHRAGEQICSETEERQFCIAFMMAIIALYLAPNKIEHTCKPFFGAVQQVDKLSQMDWCNFTATYLFEGIKEFKQSNYTLIKVKGCVHILSVIFIDLVKNAGLNIPEGFPRICIVTTLHKELAISCSSQVYRLEESVYASLLDKIPKDTITKRRECTKLMETRHHSRATRSHQEGRLKQPEDPLKHGRYIPGASQKNHLVSAELGTIASSPNTLSLAIVEPPELDTPTPSTAPSFFTEAASHEYTHTRQESFILAANADSTQHHCVEQEHINFPSDGQQLPFNGPSSANADSTQHHSVEQEHINFLSDGQQLPSNGPSSERYAAQIAESVQIAPNVSLRRNRTSPSTMEEGHRNTKKARVEQPSGHVEPAGEGAIVDTSLLNCPLCSRPFKPPVFQCKGGHLACGTCIAELPGIQCQKCEHGGAFDVHNMMMDTIVLSAKVKCSHDGCQSYVRYHELDDHQSTCPCAPCFCTEPGCGFAGLPLALLSHLTTLHSWPVHSIKYGMELRLQVPVSEPRRLLLGEEDSCVFVLVVGAVGQSPATAVSVVRLGACPTLQPRYMVNILAYRPPTAASRRAHMLLLDMEVESSTRHSEVAVEELPPYLTLPPTYLVGAGASNEVSLDIRIDKIVS